MSTTVRESGHISMQKGALILCGGQSSRMGRDKALLRFGPETMLQRVVRLVGKTVAADQIVVVAAPRQPVPELPQDVIIARDSDEYMGPLAGMAIGLKTLQQRFKNVAAAYVTGCDFPLLVPTYIEKMFLLLDDFDAVVPVDGGQRHGLAAVYRPTVLAHVEELLAKRQLRLQSLLECSKVREVATDELRSVDPSLNSLLNVNSETDYLRALTLAGIRSC